MSRLTWQGLALVALFLVLPAECSQRRTIGVQKNNARKAIIRCCGKIRCLNVTAKNRTFSLGASSVTKSDKMPSKATPTTQKVAISTPLAKIVASPTGFETTAAALLEPSIKTTTVETTLVSENSGTMTETLFTSSFGESSSTSITTKADSSIAQTSTTVTTSTTTTTTTTSTTSTTTTTTTSTTMKPKICPSPSCEIHKQSNLLPRLNVSDVPAGKMHFHAGSFYFASKINLSLSDAVRSCLALNMTLLNIDLKNMPLYFNMLTDLGLKSVWTSGSSEGTDCDRERTFAWCSSGTLFTQSEVTNSALWVKLPDGSPSAARCLILSAINRAVLTQVDCVTDRKPFVCQVTWDQNIQKCCSIGMQPIAHSTLTEQQCLADFTKGNWSGNLNYWTGGSQAGCKGLWGNCVGTTFTTLATNLIWASDQNTTFPHKQNCMHLRVNLNSANASAVSAKNCSSKFVYACQSKPTLPPCTDSKCPKTCMKDNSRFNASTEIVLKPFSYGDWYTTCGRTLFFPFHKTTWKEAWNFCCSFDMKLLSIEKSLTLGCITKFSTRYSSTAKVDLWTSGISNGCPNRYGWCGKKSKPELAEVNWAQGQPNSDSGDCVFVQFSNTTVNESVLALGNCSQKINFVCEKPLGETQGDTQQYECMSLYNVSGSEMTVFKSGNFTATSFPLKLKCFLKCIGDLTGLLMSGKLVMSIEMLRIIEDYSTTSTELEQNLAISDQCGTSREESECAKAAAIYQCGREKAPAVTSAIQFGFSNKSALTGTPVNKTLPGVPVDERYCRMKTFPCTVDTALRNTLISTGSTTFGSNITTPQGKTYFKTINFEPNTWMLHECHRTCCMHGLTLAEFYSPSEALALKPIFSNQPADVIIQEVWVNGQQQDVWCGSQRPITDLSMYNSGYRDHSWGNTSCYYLYHQQLAVRKTDAECGPFGKTFSPASCLCM